LAIVCFCIVVVVVALLLGKLWLSCTLLFLCAFLLVGGFVRDLLKIYAGVYSSPNSKNIYQQSKTK